MVRTNLICISLSAPHVAERLWSERLWAASMTQDSLTAWGVGIASSIRNLHFTGPSV